MFPSKEEFIISLVNFEIILFDIFFYYYYVKLYYIMLCLAVVLFYVMMLCYVTFKYRCEMIFLQFSILRDRTEY